MANASRDQNHVPTLLIADSADGITPINLKIDPTTHGIVISDGTTGSDLSSDPAKRDANRVPILMGVSSADGVTPVPIYGDASTGGILTKST